MGERACRNISPVVFGAAGTWFWVDPTNDIVFVGMIQRMIHPDNHELLYRSHATVYQALVEPAK